MKENLLKDIFNVYSLREGSIQSLPKNIVRSETRYVCQEVQTDSCLSRMLFTSKSEIEDLKTDLLGKISELREEFAALKNHPLPPNTVLDSSVIKGCSFLVERSLGLVLKSGFCNFNCLNDPLRYWSV